MWFELKNFWSITVTIYFSNDFFGVCICVFPSKTIIVLHKSKTILPSYQFLLQTLSNFHLINTWSPSFLISQLQEAFFFRFREFSFVFLGDFFEYYLFILNGLKGRKWLWRSKWRPWLELYLEKFKAKITAYYFEGLTFSQDFCILITKIKGNFTSKPRA